MLVKKDIGTMTEIILVKLNTLTRHLTINKKGECEAILFARAFAKEVHT